MLRFLLFLTLFFSLSAVQTIHAANLFAGKSKAATVCSQCHGIITPAIGAPFPPLAGRNVDYLRLALRQYRDKTRISPIMNNIAGSLTDQDINDITAYYANSSP